MKLTPMSSRSAAIRSEIIYLHLLRRRDDVGFCRWRLGSGGHRRVVTHVKANGGTAYQDKATAKLDHGNLIVTGSTGAPGEVKFARTLIKDPRGPDPLPVIVSVLPKGPPRSSSENQPAGSGRRRYRATFQPGPWKSQLTEKDVVGVWLGFGTGAPKAVLHHQEKLATSSAVWSAGPATTPTLWRHWTTSKSRERHTQSSTSSTKTGGRQRAADVLQARHRSRRMERNAMYHGGGPSTVATTRTETSWVYTWIFAGRAYLN